MLIDYIVYKILIFKKLLCTFFFFINIVILIYSNWIIRLYKHVHRFHLE